MRIAYVFIRPLLPLLRVIAPRAVISSEELGRAMTRAAGQRAPSGCWKCPTCTRSRRRDVRSPLWHRHDPRKPFCNTRSREAVLPIAGVSYMLRR